MQTDAPDEAADVFVAQGVQFVLPVPAAKVPGEHNLHAVAPVVLEKEPCAHRVGPVAPCDGFVPMGAKKPGCVRLQAVAPVTLLNEPPRHPRQTAGEDEAVLMAIDAPEANVPMGQGERSKLRPAGMGTQTLRVVSEVDRAGKMPVSGKKDHAPV